MHFWYQKNTRKIPETQKNVLRNKYVTNKVHQASNSSMTSIQYGYDNIEWKYHWQETVLSFENSIGSAPFKNILTLSWRSVIHINSDKRRWKLSSTVRHLCKFSRERGNGCWIYWSICGIHLSTSWYSSKQTTEDDDHRGIS